MTQDRSIELLDAELGRLRAERDAAVERMERAWSGFLAVAVAKRKGWGHDRG
jgi:hypothetical protein